MAVLMIIADNLYAGNILTGVLSALVHWYGTIGHIWFSSHNMTKVIGVMR